MLKLSLTEKELNPMNILIKVKGKHEFTRNLSVEDLEFYLQENAQIRSLSSADKSLCKNYDAAWISYGAKIFKSKESFWEGDKFNYAFDFADELIEVDSVFGTDLCNLSANSCPNKLVLEHIRNIISMYRILRQSRFMSVRVIADYNLKYIYYPKGTRVHISGYRLKPTNCAILQAVALSYSMLELASKFGALGMGILLTRHAVANYKHIYAHVAQTHIFYEDDGTVMDSGEIDYSDSEQLNAPYGPLFRIGIDFEPVIKGQILNRFSLLQAGLWEKI